jgi:hypothetical protein
MRAAAATQPSAAPWVLRLHPAPFLKNEAALRPVPQRIAVSDTAMPRNPEILLTTIPVMLFQNGFRVALFASLVRRPALSQIARRKRPRRCRAAEQRDEMAPVHMPSVRGSHPTTSF